jgi:DNA modification methylase
LTPYYQDSHCTIYHGDCREVLPGLEPVDLVLTDPPYGIAYNSGHEGSLPRSIAGDLDTSARDDALRLLDGLPAFVFGSWKIAPPTGTRMALVWDTKGALGMGALDLPWKPSFQLIFILGIGFEGHRGGDVLRFAPVQSTARNGRKHPNEKPALLLLELLSKHSGKVVLDPFMGSGTTLRAAKDLGRKAIGVEIEERYCEIAAKRLAQEVLAL